MCAANQRDDARFVRPEHLAGVEVVSVSYSNRKFPQHSHPEYVVGAVTAGAESLVVRGQRHVVESGNVLRLHPDETHSNATLGEETLQYRVAYLPRATVSSYLDAPQDVGFPGPVTTRPDVFQSICRAHQALMTVDSGELEQESAIHALVRAMTYETRPARDKVASPAQIAWARAYIDEHFARGFGLTTLAEATGLSVFHFARSFKKAVGLSPLAYRNQRRIAEARALLTAGQPIVHVALAVGFADQSHFTRQFQRLVGTSPGRYLQQ